MRAFPGKVDGYGAELRDFRLAVLEGKPLDAAPEHSLGARHVPFGGKPLGEGVAIGAPAIEVPRGLAHSNFVIRTEP